MWRVKIIGLAFFVGVLLFSIERFLLPYERVSMFAWFFLSGNSSSITPISERVSPKNIGTYKEEIKRLLQSSASNSLEQNTALAFAQEFAQELSQDASLQEQLILIAYEHPNAIVRCFWQQKLKTGHNLHVITTYEGNTSASAYPLSSQECESQ